MQKCCTPRSDGKWCENTYTANALYHIKPASHPPPEMRHINPIDKEKDENDNGNDDEAMKKKRNGIQYLVARGTHYYDEILSIFSAFFYCYTAIDRRHTYIHNEHLFDNNPQAGKTLTHTRTK